MDFLRLIFTAIIPILIIALIIYNIDRYDREPIKLLAKVMLFGAIAVIPVILIEKLLQLVPIFGIVGKFYSAFIVAGLTEEIFKRRVVLKHAFNKPVFNEHLDGIVYCVFAALGFAALENVLYVLSYQAVSPNIALYRGLLSVPAHTFFGVSMGYFLSLSKYSIDPASKRRYYRLSLLVPVMLHGAYDFILFVGTPIMLLVFVPFIIYMWVSGIKKLRKFAKLSKLNHTGEV
jgi:RsiW-degrading membrane proteinase PrsW (M82 family)